MKQYLQHRIADFALCLLMTVSLTAAVCTGFELPAGLPNDFLISLIAAVLTGLFLFLSYQKRYVLIGALAGFAVLVGLAIYLRTVNPFANETENGGFVVALSLGITALLVFLLARTKPGTVVLFLLGTVICAGSVFLQFSLPLWCFLLFEVSVCAMFFYRVWFTAIARADIDAPQRQWDGILQIALLGVAGLALATGIYFAIVRPLNPPTQELKLITQLKSMDILQVLGVYRTEIILDPELSSDAPPEDSEQGGDAGDEDSDALDNLDEPDGFDEPNEEETPPPESSIPPDLGLDELENLIRYDFGRFNPLWLLLLFPIAIVAAYGIRVLWKRRWRETVSALPGRDAVAEYYQFFLTRLNRAGVKKPSQQTLREYVESSAVQLQPLINVDGGFGALTEIYERTVYGHAEVSDAELQLFANAYSAFYPALRRELGPVKYYATAFRY